MTWKPEDIVVSDDQVNEFTYRYLDARPHHVIDPDVVRRLLAEYIAARMPDRKSEAPDDYQYDAHVMHARGHNAALDAVARGRT